MVSKISIFVFIENKIYWSNFSAFHALTQTFESKEKKNIFPYLTTIVYNCIMITIRMSSSQFPFNCGIDDMHFSVQLTFVSWCQLLWWTYYTIFSDSYHCNPPEVYFFVFNKTQWLLFALSPSIKVVCVLQSKHWVNRQSNSWEESGDHVSLSPNNMQNFTWITQPIAYQIRLFLVSREHVLTSAFLCLRLLCNIYKQLQRCLLQLRYRFHI